MTSLAVVSAGSNSLAVLAHHYRAAWDKTQAGRAQWIEGTLELAAVILEGRVDLPDHRAFSRWVKQHNLPPINKDARAALINFAEDPVVARDILEKTTRTSWHWIWVKRPKVAQKCTPLQVKKGAISYRSGSSQRKRAARIPDVMRDDAPDMPSPTKPERKAVVLKGLTRQQVDPDFKGTPLEFTTKYGHVLLQTKEQIEENKRQEILNAWLGTVSDLDRAGKAMLAALATVDPATLRDWMSKPAKTEKFRAWAKSIQLACEALGRLLTC